MNAYVIVNVWSASVKCDDWNQSVKLTVKHFAAYDTQLCRLTRDELRYILDPKDVYGPDFPGETFRVLKEREEREYGAYRRRRLVLEKSAAQPYLKSGSTET